MSKNEHNKVKKYGKKFEYNIPKNSREVLLLDKKNGNTLWVYAIAKEMKELERLDVFQFYPPTRQCIWFLEWRRRTYDTRIG